MVSNVDMTESKATIGDLLGQLHGDRHRVRDKEVEVIMPDYHDPHFDSGFGIRTTGEMTRDQVRWLLRLNPEESGGGGTFRRLLKRFGAMQIKCPEIRSEELGSGLALYHRSPTAVSVHKDSPLDDPVIKTSDLALTIAGEMPVSGSTMVIPDAEVLRLLQHLGQEISFDPERQIKPGYVEAGSLEASMSVGEAVRQGINIYQEKYWYWLKTVLGEMKGAFNASPREAQLKFTGLLEGNPHTLAHDWSTSEVLGNSERYTVHGPGNNAAGTFLMRTLFY